MTGSILIVFTLTSLQFCRDLPLGGSVQSKSFGVGVKYYSVFSVVCAQCDQLPETGKRKMNSKEAKSKLCLVGGHSKSIFSKDIYSKILLFVLA